MKLLHIHGHNTGTGVATYQQNLTKELKRLGVAVHETTPQKTEYIIAGKRVGGFISQTWSSRFTPKVAGADLMHSASNWVFAGDCGSIMVHDLNPLFLRGWAYSRALFKRQRRRLRRVVVITPSEAVRQSVSDFLRVPSDEITVAPNGVDLDLYQLPKLRAGGYLLSVGDYRDYKRVEDAVVLAVAMGLKLIRVGPPANDEYGRCINGMGTLAMGDRFRDLGMVSPEMLARLYQNAYALVSTSRYEGFNLPPLEAAASGTPSILADTPVNREIHGNLACYLSPDMPVAGIKDRLADLHKVPYMMRNNAARFTWRRSAQQHLKAWGWL